MMFKSQLRIFITLGLAFVMVSQPLHAETLKGIRQRGKLIVAVKDNTRPLGFRGENGELQGLEIDIARRLSLEIFGVEGKVEFRPVNNQDRLRVLFDRQVDLTIARLTVNRSRSRVVDFSRPYYQDSTAILTNRTGPTSLTDLAGKSVAVLQASSSAEEATSQLPKSKLVPVSSYQGAKALLDSKQVVAFIADRSLLVGWSQEYPQQYRLLTANFAASPIGIAMPRGLQHAELRSFVDGAIDRWQKEGWLSQRIGHWGL
jgi:polar amino acid transport system substrate-binding protein